MENKVLGNGIAVINKIQSTVDSGARITLDFGADSKELIKSLFDLKLGEDSAVMVAFVRYEHE